jgi:uncharacterized membrane protein
MDQSDIAFIVIAFLVAVLAHALIARFLVACLVIVIASPTIYAVEEFIRLKLPPAKLFYLPFIYLVFGFLAACIASAVGLPFYAFRRWCKRNGKGKRQPPKLSTLQQ